MLSRCFAHRVGLIAGIAVLAVAARTAAPQAPPPAAPTPELGTVAPDFALPGATRYGLLRDSIRLATYRGQTVVLAFFFEARTKG